MEPTKKLRELLAAEKILVMPGCYDCASARLIEYMGFKGVYLTGYGTEASLLGRPDMGFMTMTEIVNHARNIAACIDRPLISDMDAGFGGMFNFERTIQSFEAAGVAGVHFEDQTQPKRCACLSGKSVISTAEMVEKVKLAVASRRNPDFVLVARSDAKEQYDFDEVLRRLHAYLDAGADLLMVGERYTLEEIHKICETFPGRLLFDGGIAEWEETNLSIAEFEKIGIKVLIYPLAGIYAAMRGVMEVYRPLLQQGQISVEHLENHGMEMDQVNRILGIDRCRAMYSQYDLT